MAVQGNFKMGGRSFAAKQASSGGSKKKKKTGTSYGPAGQVGSDQKLQMLIDRKDELKNLPGGQGDDRNLYQVKMNEFKNQNEQNRRAYADRFPIQNFFTSGLPSIASKIMPGAGVLSLLANIGNKIKGGLSRAGDFFGGQNDPVQLAAGVRQGPPAYDASGLAGYQDAIMRNLPPVRSTNPADMGIMAAQPDFRFDGPFVENPQDMNIQEKMTAKDYFDDLSPAEKEYVLGFRQDNPAGMLQTDPNMFTNPATGNPLIFGPTQSEINQLRGNIPGISNTTKMTRNMMEQLDPFTNPDVPFVPMNEGGLASINNPEYNMLMKASNFDV